MLLSINISIDYPNKPGVLRDVSLEIAGGEVLGVVGASGCGKSSMALAIMRLLHLKHGTAKGSIHFNGRDLLTLSEREMRRLRGRDISLVLQSPLTSLNPALRIGTQMLEAWKVHANGAREEATRSIRQTLTSVNLPDDEDFLRRKPSQISVGQAQRVLIAMAILHRPCLLLADEPTSSLDVITQAEVLDLFKRLNRELGMTMLYISHDLLSVASLCNRVAILEAGELVECAPTEQIFHSPQHPFTQRLVAAIPEMPERKMIAKR